MLPIKELQISVKEKNTIKMVTKIPFHHRLDQRGQLWTRVSVLKLFPAIEKITVRWIQISLKSCIVIVVIFTY